MRGNGFPSVGVALTDDLVLELPCTSERFRGREKFATVNAEFPCAQ